ncbi:MAG: magnesium transporter [Nanoarchaeota archaeon]|nr:magnesium transporter [Nanoarchaeota archaeon]
MSNSLRSILNKFNYAENKIKYFSDLIPSQKAYLLSSINNRFKKEILAELVESEILEIIRFMDPDEITDVLQLLPSSKKNRIFRKLNVNLKEKIDFLLKFTPKSAAGLMSLNYIIIRNSLPYSQIIEKVKVHIEMHKKEPTILIVDEEKHFLGELRLSALFLHKKSHLYSHIKHLPSVKYNEKQDEVIDIFKKNDHEKIVVLDEEDLILGIIHAKDIFKIIEDENTEDFYGLAGLHKEEDISDSALQKVHYRLGWLIINLFTAFLAAFVVAQFEDTISKFVLLAAFMPIIAGMGGNAGTQTTAILIRSMALKKIDSKLTKKILTNEIFAGFVNGTILGLIVGSIAYLFNPNINFAIVVSLSIFLNLFIASFFGSLIPLILKSFGFDPASSSNVFVTTMTDVFGFLIFLGLATIMLI